MKLNRFSKVLLLVSLLLPLNIVFASDLVLSAPPRETAAAGEELYAPLAKHLSELLNRKVIYKHPGNWFKYQSEMKKGHYDIVFDGPHFISWRIAHLKHEVLIKLPSKLQFMVVTNQRNYKLNKGKDLIGKKFCGISPPNLSSLSFLASFGNPMRQPRIIGIKGGMEKVFEAFEKKKCHAAILRNVFYKNKLSQKKRDELKVIFTSPLMANQAMSISSRLSKKEKSLIKASLLKGEGVNSLNKIVKRFSGNENKPFVETNNKEYLAYNKYLEGVVFGW